MGTVSKLERPRHLDRYAC